MHPGARVFSAALGVVIILTVAASAASASRVIQVRGAERGVAAAGQITFGGDRLEASGQIVCDVTLLRTLGSAIPKTLGTLFGRVTGVAIDRGARGEHCRKGSLFESVTEIVALRERGVAGTHSELGSGILLYVVTGGRAELWGLIYRVFLGSLPEISGILFTIQEAQLLISGPIECLYKGGIEALVPIARRLITQFTVLLTTTRLARDSGSILCPIMTWSLSGMFLDRPNLTIELL